MSVRVPPVDHGERHGLQQHLMIEVYCDAGRGASRTPRQITGEGVVFNSKVQHLQDLLDDDKLAAEEAKSQGGVPGYCADRYFRASAGGQYCDKFDAGRSK